MTPEQINISIAEACGFTGCCPHCSGCGAIIHFDADGEEMGASDCDCLGQPIPLPDYHGDLNAMHEAFASKRSERNFIARYFSSLYAIVDTDGSCPAQLSDDDKIHNATASQRAEAFLRTIGKWREE